MFKNPSDPYSKKSEIPMGCYLEVIKHSLCGGLHRFNHSIDALTKHNL